MREIPAPSSSVKCSHTREVPASEISHTREGREIRSYAKLLVVPQTRGDRIVKERLKQAMTENGYDTDTKLDKELELKQVGRWKSGASTPTGSNLVNLTKKLHVTADWLFGRDDIRDARESLAKQLERLVGADEAKIVRELGRLQPEGRSAVVQRALGWIDGALHGPAEPRAVAMPVDEDEKIDEIFDETSGTPGRGKKKRGEKPTSKPQK